MSMNGTKAPLPLDMRINQEKEDPTKMYVRHYRSLLCSVPGEDPDREDLRETPKRAANVLTFFTKGYGESLAQVVGGAVYDAAGDSSMVVVKDLEVFSVCEHHLLPFMGRISIGYLPDGKLLGLSKFANIVEMYSRRLQEQERLTREIALAVSEAVQPAGVAVVIEAAHMCMVMRGVQKTSSKTVTSCMLGEFKENADSRREFLGIIKQ